MNERTHLPGGTENGGTRLRALVGLVLVLIVGIAAGRSWRGTTSSGSQPESQASESTAATTYYCPMHPSYTSDRPGDCPIATCGWFR